MKKIKNILIIVILLSIIVLLYALIIKNSSVDRLPSNLISGKFEYIPSTTRKSVEEIYYYSDDYFLESGKKENSHLRTMIMNIMLSGTVSLDKKEKTYNIEKLLTDIGYQDIVVYDYDKSSKDTIGMVIANKLINNYNVIIVSLRGDHYGLEWSSNFKAGKSGNIKNFDSASKRVLELIKTYINEKNLKTKNKLVVTGYSRAGAISNLVGVYLNENLSDYYLNSDDDIYVYTFEAPNNSSSKKIYKNIHNVVNKNDIVTHVYPSKWGLQNNGVEEDITSYYKYIDIYNMNYGSIISGGEIFEKNNNGSIKKNEFLSEFFDWLSINSLDRNTYDDSIGKYLPNVIKVMFGKSSEEIRIISNFFKTDLINELKKDSKELYLMLLAFINSGKISDKQLEEYSSYIRKCFDSVKSKNTTLTDSEYNLFKDFFSDYKVLSMIKDFVSSSYNEKPTAYHISTMLNNLDTITKEHYNTTNYELVKKYDSYYK